MTIYIYINRERIIYVDLQRQKSTTSVFLGTVVDCPWKQLSYVLSSSTHTCITIMKGKKRKKKRKEKCDDDKHNDTR